MVLVAFPPGLKLVWLLPPQHTFFPSKSAFVAAVADEGGSSISENPRPPTASEMHAFMSPSASNMLPIVVSEAEIAALERHCLKIDDQAL